MEHLNPTIEQWLTIDEFPNYQVSNFGRVRNATTNKVLSPALKAEGYMKLMIFKERGGKGSNVYVHRLVASTFIENPQNKTQIDHIDQYRQNNCVQNLRWATQSENNANARKRKNATSKYKGVSWDKDRKRWVAEICSNGKSKNLGRYTKEKDACRAYNEAAKEIHGEYAVLNEISDSDEE
jgi:hypothetical protein